MGVNCKIMLPNNARLTNVAEVLAILSGQQPRKEQFQSGDGWAVRVDTIRYRTHDYLPQCPTIEWIQHSTVDKVEEYHSVMFHYEPEHGSHRLIMPPSTAWWLAAGKRLVDFFGGELDYNDSDSTDVDYRKRKKSDEVNSPEDTPEWEVFQQRMFEVKPITEKEIKDMVKHAVYK